MWQNFSKEREKQKELRHGPQKVNHITTSSPSTLLHPEPPLQPCLSTKQNKKRKRRRKWKTHLSQSDSGFGPLQRVFLGIAKLEASSRPISHVHVFEVYALIFCLLSKEMSLFTRLPSLFCHHKRKKVHQTSQSHVGKQKQNRRKLSRPLRATLWNS